MVASRTGRRFTIRDAEATLIVIHGDPLLIPTNVDKAFIHGRQIDLRNKQSALAEKYIEKYRQLGLWPEDGDATQEGHDHGRGGK